MNNDRNIIFTKLYLTLLLLLLLFLRRLLLDRRLAGMLDLDGALVVCLRLILPGRGDGQHAIRWQARWHLVNVTLFRYHVFAYELPWNPAMLILLLLVLCLDYYALVYDLDIDLVRLELLYVQNYLEFVFVGFHGRRAAFVAIAQQLSPGSIVNQGCRSYTPITLRGETFQNTWIRQLIGSNTKTKMLIEEPMRIFQVLPPVGEEQRYQGHVEAAVAFSSNWNEVSNKMTDENV